MNAEAQLDARALKRALLAAGVLCYPTLTEGLRAAWETI